MTTRPKLLIPGVLIGLPAAIFAIVYMLSAQNPHNDNIASIIFAGIAAIIALAIAIVVTVAILGARGMKPIRVEVRMPSAGLDDTVNQAMGATGFAFESERGATTAFKQDWRSAFFYRGAYGLSHRHMLVTKTTDGFTLAGPSWAVEKVLPFIGGAVVSRH